MLAAFDPGFDLFQVPDDAAGGEAEAAREFAALFHFVDRRLGQRHDLMQFGTSDGATKGKRVVLQKLG